MINSDFKNLTHLLSRRNVKTSNRVQLVWNKKNKILTQLFSGLIVCGGASCGAHAKGELSKISNSFKTPNIIYILADDMGYNDVGVYGQKLIKTPQLDQMAAEGMRFTQHYSGSTVSAPSRGCLMTGLHTGHGYIRGNYSMEIEGNLPIPEIGIGV